MPRIAALLLLASCVWAGAALAQSDSQDAAASEAAAADALEPAAAALQRDQRPLEYWLEQLASNRFANRQVATRQVLRFGQQAVEPLSRAALSGELELTQRAIDILQTLATAQPPDDESGAWAALETLAVQAGGSAAIRARGAMEDIRRQREEQAYVELSAAGVQIGFRDFVMHSRALNREVVWIDRQWKGDVDALRWLRWVKRIDHAHLEGAAVRREVLEQLVQMPDLRSIVMREATLRDDIFAPLQQLPRIDELEFRYITLDLEDADKIARLPIRVSLGLMGTSLPADGAERIAQALPGLSLTVKQGGFLGVTTHGLSDRCQIDSVKVGSAAAEAGLRAGDVIIQIEQTPIAAFEDLQKAISMYLPGDEVTMRYDRAGEIGEVHVTLGRLEGE